MSSSEFGECQKCKRNRLLRYEVTSDAPMSMRVCEECGRVALKIVAQEWSKRSDMGQITVRELS